MSRLRIKICGITRAEDGLLAAQLGADALGLVFYPASSRAVAAGSIPAIAGELPAFITVVGLFVDPAAAEVEEVLESGRVQCLQFHGNESPGFCESFGVPYIKAIRVSDLASARQQLQQFLSASSIILDAHVDGEAGGTGKTFDWAIARQLVDESQKTIILAGGLTPENLSGAVDQVGPYGVDVSSGVELNPGIKDPHKLKRFFDNAYR